MHRRVLNTSVVRRSESRDIPDNRTYQHSAIEGNTNPSELDQDCWLKNIKQQEFNSNNLWHIAFKLVNCYLSRNCLNSHLIFIKFELKNVTYPYSLYLLSNSSTGSKWSRKLLRLTERLGIVFLSLLTFSTKALSIEVNIVS